MMDYVTIDNFFRNIKIKYLECDLKIKDGKIYFEDKNTIREVSIFLSKFFYFSFLLCIAFNPRNSPRYPDSVIKGFGTFFLALFLVVACFMALFLISLIILKIYNVLDYRNNTIRKEIYIFGLKILKLDEISMNNMFAVTNNVIAKSYPPYKNVSSINDVPIEVDEITGLYLQNEVLFLTKDGTVIHLWLGSTIESYDNCIEIVNFISETWSLRKITCEKRNMFVIRFKDKYDIEKISVINDNSVQNTIFVFVILSLLAFIAPVLLGIR